MQDILTLTDKQIARFWSKINKRGPDECWEWSGCVQSRGYGYIRFNGQQLLSHRIAYFLSKDIQPGKLCVCHHCDNPKCCNPCHLFLGTVADNNRDMFAKDRAHSHPKKHSGRAILTDDMVLEIRGSSQTPQELSIRYRVNYRTILDALNRKTWKGTPHG